jgi:hypothetical protein
LGLLAGWMDGWLPTRALVYMKMNLVSFRECSKQNTHTHTQTKSAMS